MHPEKLDEYQGNMWISKDIPVIEPVHLRPNAQHTVHVRFPQEIPADLSNLQVSIRSRYAQIGLHIDGIHKNSENTILLHNLTGRPILLPADTNLFRLHSGPKILKPIGHERIMLTDWYRYIPAGSTPLRVPPEGPYRQIIHAQLAEIPDNMAQGFYLAQTPHLTLPQGIVAIIEEETQGSTHISSMLIDEYTDWPIILEYYGDMKNRATQVNLTYYHLAT